MNNPIISIIIPVYKVEEYLERCIASIINQSYGNLEIILVDDGSPDNCGQMCDTYAKKDRRIQVIHKGNGGLSDARNAGLKVCKGELVAFVDSDDWVTEEYFEELLRNMITTNADISICNFLSLENENEKPINNDSRLSTYSNIQSLDELYGSLNVAFVVSWGKLYKAELFSEKKFPIGKIHEDEFITYLLLFDSKVICYTDKQMYFYWQRANSIMFNLNLGSYLNRIEAFEEQIVFYKSHNLLNLYKKTILKTFGAYDFLFKQRSHFNEITKDPLFINAYKENLKRILGQDDLKYLKRFKYSILFYNPRIANKLLPFLRRLIVSAKSIRNLIRKNKIIIIDAIKTYSGYRLIKKKYFFNKIKTQKEVACSNGKNAIFLMATPCHGNMGDHAIVNAEYEFLEVLGCKDQVIEVSNDDYLKYKKEIVKHIEATDIIIIDGGGNLGTLWKNEDDKISEIITTYPKNKVVVFPQTCYYDNSPEATARIQKNKIIYENHQNLTISLRDKRSFDFFRDNFSKVSTLHVPDIVLYSNYSSPNSSREGVLFCLRKDIEKVVSDVSMEKLKVYLNHNEIIFSETDTVINKEVGKESREFELQKKLQEFSGSSLVITDRLHGMIFAYITGTPCIAIDNISRKVSGVASWISGSKSLMICDGAESIQANILRMYGTTSKYANDEIKYQLEELAKIIQR